MKIVILEDSDSELQKLRKELNNWSFETNEEIYINTYISGEDFFSKPENFSSTTDLFILDISMKKISGIDVAKRLRALDYQGEIIFLTAFKEFVFDGYEVRAFNYLLKPINSTLLRRCLNEIAKKKNSTCHIYRDSKQGMISIPYADIIFCSVNRHYVDITTKDTIYNQHIDLSELMKILPNKFIQVHRSYIVNMAHIFSVTHNKIHLSNNTVVDIGRTYASSFKKEFLNYSTRFNRDEEYY
jgi:DNA-binding LytR/AlgR family response regulator